MNEIQRNPNGFMRNLQGTVQLFPPIIINKNPKIRSKKVN
jgi:hypothetical protein